MTRLLPPAFRGSAPEGARRRTIGRLSLLLFPLGCALAALAIGQDANYDLLNYHYYIAYAFLHDRLPVDVYTAQLQSLLNPFLDLPIYFLINHTPPRVEAAVVGAIQGINLVLVYAIARRIAPSRVVAVAAAVAAGVAGGFASEIGNSMGDTLVSIPLLIGVLCALRAIELTGAPSTPAPAGAGSGSPSAEGAVGTPRRVELLWWAAAGCAAGLGAGLKFSELPVAIGIVLGAAAVRGTVPARVRRLVAGAAGAIAGALATSGYWSWYLWRNYDDPIAFTQASFGIFHSPYVPRGSLGTSKFGPKSLAEAVVYPVYWVLHPLGVAEVRFRELSMPLAYVLAAVLVILSCARAGRRLVRARAGREQWRDVHGGAARPDAHADADRYLVALFAVTLAVWMKVFDIYRYIIPLELISPVVVYAAARRLLALLPSGSARRATAARAFVPGFVAVCAICAASAYPGNYWQRAPFGSRFFSLATPAVLDNGRIDAVAEVGGQPMGFLFPQLPARVIAIGGIGNLLTPANRALAHRALDRVRADHGDVDVAFVDVPARPGLSTPRGTSRYLARLGAPRLVARACDVVRAEIGAGYQPVKFCRFGPAPPTR